MLGEMSPKMRQSAKLSKKFKFSAFNKWFNDPSFCKFKDENSWTLFCVPKYSIDAFFCVISLLCIIFIFFLSAKVGKFSCRRVTLNLFLGNLIKHTATMAHAIIIDFIPGYLPDFVVQNTWRVSTLIEYCYYPAFFFIIQTLSLFSTICAGHYPLFYQRYFNDRKWTRYFIMSHCAAIIIATILGGYFIAETFLILPKLTIGVLPLTPEHVDSLLTVIGLALMSAMLVLAGISLSHKISHEMTPERRKGLKIIMCYCAASTLTMIVNTVSEIIEIIVFISTPDYMYSVLVDSYAITQTLRDLQPAMHAVVVLLCFRPYREALRDCIVIIRQKRSTTIMVKQSASTTAMGATKRTN